MIVPYELFDDMNAENDKIPLFNALQPTAVRGQLRELWHNAFGDDYEFIDAFFAVYGCEGLVHTLSLGNKVLSALYALPFTLYAGGEYHSAVYIYAVATLHEYRGRGYMALLMERVEGLLRSQGVTLFYLLPASDALRGYYARLGYVDCSGRAVHEFKVCGNEAAAGTVIEAPSVAEIFPLWIEWQHAHAPVILHSRELLELNLLSCKMQGGGCFVARQGGVPVAAAFVIKQDGVPLLLDVKGRNAGACTALKASLCHYFGVDALSYFADEGGVPLCMCRSFIGVSKVPPCVKISLMLDK